MRRAITATLPAPVLFVFTLHRAGAAGFFVLTQSRESDRPTRRRHGTNISLWMARFTWEEDNINQLSPQ
jgi:hypothetical protein